LESDQPGLKPRISPETGEQNNMPEIAGIRQLKKYAEDLKKVYDLEKEKRTGLENANQQMKKYAEALNQTIRKLKEANRKLKLQVEFEEQEKLMQKKLIQINKMTSLGTMAAGIAHEINNPISYILGNSQILQELWEEIEKIMKESLEDQKNFALKGIPFEEITVLIPKILKNNIEGARQISQITGKLKDFSRPETQPFSGKIDLNQAIEYAIAVMDKQIKKQTSNFQVKLGGHIPPAAGNTHELEQVFINLIQNALQALPDKNRGIQISSSLDKKTGLIKIKIRDEGKGMTREIMDRIMEPFFTTREDSGGTGLGLYICYSIIKKAGGNIEIFSEPGNGTEVVVSLISAGRREKP
jgi:signal transduction histidine kinase